MKNAFMAIDDKIRVIIMDAVIFNKFGFIIMCFRREIWASKFEATRLQGCEWPTSREETLIIKNR